MLGEGREEAQPERPERPRRAVLDRVKGGEAHAAQDAREEILAMIQHDDRDVAAKGRQRVRIEVIGMEMAEIEIVDIRDIGRPRLQRRKMMP